MFEEYTIIRATSMQRAWENRKIKVKVEKFVKIYWGIRIRTNIHIHKDPFFSVLLFQSKLELRHSLSFGQVGRKLDLLLLHLVSGDDLG